MSITNHNIKYSARFQTGFSLIEISIVLVILGLLLGGLMTPMATQIENSRRNETQITLEQLKESIYGYALINGRLPCPDTNSDGAEDRAGNTCSSASGFLPWSTLAMGNADAWGQNFTYRVTTSFADNVDGTACGGTPTLGVSFSLCSLGDIQVRDQAAGNIVASNIPAIIVSRGKNWALAMAADETENTNNDATFISKNYSSVTGSEYDDLVTWIVPGVLVNRMVTAGRLP